MGDAQAREAVVRENLKLVHYVARRFQDRGAEYEDLFQYGCMGLVKAVDRFDASYGVCFSTYAVPLIMGEIRRYLRDDGPVHVSRTIHDHACRVERFREEYIGINGSEPSLSEIASGTALSCEDVMLALGSRQRVRSLSEPAGGDDGILLMDTIGRDVMSAVDTKIALAQLLARLSKDERRIILRRYFRCSTQREIAGEMGMTQVQVSRLEQRILKRLRACASEE